MQIGFETHLLTTVHIQVTFYPHYLSKISAEIYNVLAWTGLNVKLTSFQGHERHRHRLTTRRHQPVRQLGRGRRNVQHFRRHGQVQDGHDPRKWRALHPKEPQDKRSKAISVIRFGEISPLWQTFKSLWAIFGWFILYLANFCTCFGIFMCY